MHLLYAFAAAGSAIAFLLMALDKRRAARGRRRVPEWTLLLAGTPLGLPGVILGALAFRHKTRKPGFWAKGAVVAVAAALLVHAASLMNVP